MNWQNEIRLTDAYYLAIYAEDMVCGRWTKDMNIDDSRLLELRVFNEKGETRAWRPHLGAGFRLRTITDGDEPAPYFDEEHYLDIDSRCTKTLPDGRVAYRTTGGGAYTLPGKYREVKVRSYLKESMNGLTYVGDWRIVCLVPEKEV